MFRDFVAVAFTAASLAFALPAQATPKPGSPAPGFTGVTSKGREVSLSDFAGRKVILEWTNHDCPYVRKHYESGNMQELQEDMTADGVAWITIISSKPGSQGYVEAEEANALTTSRGAAPDHVVLDPEGIIGRDYDARTTPQMFLIDEAGTLLYMGAIDDQPSSRRNTVPIAHNYVRAAYAEIMEGQPVSMAATKPYGCSVKY